jgi:hypothetical protein
MTVAFVLANLLILIGVFLYVSKRENSLLKKIFWAALLVKCLAGICLGAVYASYYSTGDTFQYFANGKLLAQLATENLRQYLQFLIDHEQSAILSKLSYEDARALFFLKFVSVLNIMTGNNYWVISLYLSAISFLGAWTFVKSVYTYMPNAAWPAIVAFLFMPSVVFWSSGLIKESIACGSLFYLSSLFIQAWFDQRIPVWKSLLAVFSLWLLWALKYYYAAVFIPVTFTFLLYKYWFVHLIKPRSVLAKLAVLAVVFIFPLVLFSFAHPNFYYTVFLEVIVANSDGYTLYSAPEDLIHYHNLRPDVFSIITNSPLALFSGLFRPFITEAGNVLQFLSSLENLVLLTLTIWCVARLRKLSVEAHFILMLATALYVVLLCVFLALSTPNFGTLSRYRVGYLPYFVMLLLSEQKIKSLLQRLSMRLFGW